MNHPARIQSPSIQDDDPLTALFDAQQQAVLVHGAPNYKQRMADLEALLQLIKANHDVLIETVCKDFGNRSFAETKLSELMPIVNGIKHIRAHLKSWMRPSKRKVGMAFKPATARVMYQPLGVVGILAPWNYPLTLTLVPLMEALAAGNRVMLKPSELTPHTAELLKRLLGEIFPAEQISVIIGDASLASRFTELAFDHLVFTGSTNVGRHVMAAAARNLTPVTLELGGKSPVVIGSDFPLKKAARLVVIGKLFNAGQTCVAPDYAMVPHHLVDTFAAECLNAAKQLYPSIQGNKDYTSIISPKHYDRLMKMIDQAVAGGARIWQNGMVRGTDERKVPPTILTNVAPEADVMCEEIFGPLLPVIGYDDLEQAIAFINARPKPLALYGFSNDSAFVDQLLEQTRSGGATINGTMLHATQDDLPFGGVGNSGTGAYHGYEGFIRLSHARGVFKLSRFNMSDKVSAPYGAMTRLVTRLMLGQ